ncbi:universal stress protein [Nocardioides terrigena]|uniref:universal stress protein n=1 Tax=Nocardioides terrigena TaxID=424797 RepID=UPI00131ED270|nr:universal stress protein [Nocardioides terrigena]
MSRSLDPDHVRGAIVVAFDGSDHADRAVRWAAEQASLEHRRVAVVSVGDTADELAEDAVAAARLGHPDLAVTGETLSGDPRQVLRDASRYAYLLVVGSRGRGVVKSMLLGSVSAAVSAHAACPVVVCRPAADGDAQAGVVVGADGTPESLPVIEFAYRQACLHGLPLTVLHSFWDAAAAVAQYQEARGHKADDPDLEDLRATLATSVAGLAEKYPDVRVTLTLKHGFADEALSPRHGGWAMIVVGHHPMTSLGRLVTGSIATSVIERAHTTVAVVPQELRSS